MDFLGVAEAWPAAGGLTKRMDCSVQGQAVRLTLLDIRKMQAQLPALLKALPEAQRQKALRFRRADDRLRSLGSSLLLLRAAQGQQLQYTAAGKPFAPGRQFNVSHSGNYVVLAESACPVGIDIEEVFDSERNIYREIEEEVLRAALTDRERAWAGKSSLRFYVLWTRKESLVKCEGIGFAEEPGAIESLPEKGSEWLAEEPLRYGNEEYWLDTFLLDGHIISVAVAARVE